MSISFTQCKGGLCAAKDDGLSDADSDCFADTGDNCPTIYNPDQFDGDSDSQGEACDADDTDNSVALIKDPDLAFLSTSHSKFDASYIQPVPFDASSEPTLSSESCSYFVVGCENYFIGFLNADAEDSSIADIGSEFGDPQSDFSFINPLGFYGRPSSLCSAFNEEATQPPAVFCLNHDSGETNFVGHLTENPNIGQALNPCSTLSIFGISAEFCD